MEQPVHRQPGLPVASVRGSRPSPSKLSKARLDQCACAPVFEGTLVGFFMGKPAILGVYTKHTPIEHWRGSKSGCLLIGAVLL